MTKLQSQVDGNGRLVLPPEAAPFFGLKPGTHALVETRDNRLILHAPATHLGKLYIEATNACNLQCRTCIRNGWNETTGFMNSRTFDRIMEGLRTFSPVPSVFFGGFGEPLFHPDIVEMVARVKEIVPRVELITNATLLTATMSHQLIQAGLDGIWVSLDGARPESYADIRLGAALPETIANVGAFRDACTNANGLCRYPENMTIGVVFVAMKRNIDDLAEIVRLGDRLGATRFLVSNVLPYAPEMWKEALYSHVIRDSWLASTLFRVCLPRMDRDEATTRAVHRISDFYKISWPGADPDDMPNRCPFAEKGSAVINWEGNLSPCLPLMYDHRTFVDGLERFSKKYAVGNVSEQAIKDVWNNAEYAAFRERVQEFDFSPCTLCGGCYLSETNEEDCFGNSFPTCGGCLWAQGIIRCP